MNISPTCRPPEWGWRWLRAGSCRSPPPPRRWSWWLSNRECPLAPLTIWKWQMRHWVSIFHTSQGNTKNITTTKCQRRTLKSTPPDQTTPSRTSVGETTTVWSYRVTFIMIKYLDFQEWSWFWILLCLFYVNWHYALVCTVTAVHCIVRYSSVHSVGGVMV